MSCKPRTSRNRRRCSMPTEARIVAKTKTLKTAADPNVITMKVTLAGVRPPIWRRLVVPGSMTLGDLHQAILAGMGWHGGHLHSIDVGGKSLWRPVRRGRREGRGKRNADWLLRYRVKGLPTPTTSATTGSTWLRSKRANRRSRGFLIRSASEENGTVRRRIAAASGGMETCWSSWPIPPIPGMPISSIGWRAGFDPEEFSIERTNTRLAARFRGGCVLVKPGSPVE